MSSYITTVASCCFRLQPSWSSARIHSACRSTVPQHDPEHGLPGKDGRKSKSWSGFSVSTEGAVSEHELTGEETDLSSSWFHGNADLSLGYQQESRMESIYHLHAHTHTHTHTNTHFCLFLAEVGLCSSSETMPMQEHCVTYST